MKKYAAPSIAVGLILLLATLLSPQKGGAGQSGSLELTLPAKFLPALDANGAPRYTTAQWIEQEMRQRSKSMAAFYHNRKINRYIIPDQQWLDALLPAYRNLLRQVRVHGEDDTWDCENFSTLLSELTAVKLWQAGYYDTRVAMGWLAVDAKKSWAGMPPMMHALIFVVMADGLYIVEPQNGQSVKLSDYPNKDSIKKVFLL